MSKESNLSLIGHKLETWKHAKFVTLVFNGTFCTNRLYLAIGVWNISHRAALSSHTPTDHWSSMQDRQQQAHTATTYDIHYIRRQQSAKVMRLTPSGNVSHHWAKFVNYEWSTIQFSKVNSVQSDAEMLSYSKCSWGCCVLVCLQRLFYLVFKMTAFLT